MKTFVLKTKQVKSLISLHILALVGMYLLPFSAIAQSQNWWRTIGNSANNNDFLGTTNATDLIFKTNNNEQFRITSNGDFILKPFIGTSNRVIMTDAGGKLYSLPAGNANQILLGNGTWGNISAYTFWQDDGHNNIYYTNGKVGIGTNAPQYLLDVGGDARIQNNLYVNGGIVISPRIEAGHYLRTDSMKAMNGEIKVISDIRLKNQLQVEGSALFNGNIQANTMSAGSIMASSITAPNGVMFDTNNGIKFIAGSGGNPDMLVLGKVSPTPPSPINTCAHPVPNPALLYSGAIHLYWNNVLLSMGSDGANGFIDASGTGPGNFPSRLLLNYYCGRDVVIGNEITHSGNLIVNNKLGIGTTPSVELDVKGKVKIGLLSPQSHPNAVLTVDGEAVVKDFWVTVSSWADDEWAKESQIEDLVKEYEFAIQHKHFQEIPSEEEILKNGANVNDILTNQMRLIEKLYKYAYLLKKEVDELKKENEELRKNNMH